MAIERTGFDGINRVRPGGSLGKTGEGKRTVRMPRGVLRPATDDDDIRRQLARLRRFVETGEWDFNAPRGTYLNLLL